MGQSRGRQMAWVGGLSALVVVPIVVGLAVLRTRQWQPMLDHAALELRVRDVGTGQTPLLGPFARFQAQGVEGNHPGPIGYYLLAPGYRLFGGSAWAFLVAAALSNVAASAAAVGVGIRRAGWRGGLLVAVAVVLLARAYGIGLMVSGWNVDLPLLWWVVFGLAVWSLLCGDLAMVPVAVFAGSICAQSHVSYGPLVAALGLLVLVMAGRRVRSGWAEADGRARRRLLVWVGIGAVVGAVLWSPPVGQEISNDPGNMTVIVQSFGHSEPDEARMSLRQSGELWLAHMNVDELLRADLDREMERRPDMGSLLVLGSWLVAAGVSFRRRTPGLVELHLVVAVAAVAGLVAMSRITGPPFFYLTFWAWGTTVLMLLATAWTVLGAPSPGPPSADSASEDPASDDPASEGMEPVEEVVPVGGVLPRVQPPPWRGGRRVVGVVAGCAVLTAVIFTVEAASPEMPDAEMARALDQLVEQTVEALREDPAGCGDDCRYQVTWSDSISLGSHGVGMMAALEREGFDVAAPAYARKYVGDHRVRVQGSEDATIHLALGDTAVDAAREDGAEGGQELAYVDLYSADERLAQRERAGEVADHLHAAGFPDRAEDVREDPLTDLLQPVGPEMSRDLRGQVQELNSYVRPASVTLLMP